jgi:hypothetical protein
MQQLLGAQNGVFQPRFFFGFLLQIVDFQIWLRWGEELRPLQLVEIIVDFCGRKEPPDFRHERWQLGGELGMRLRGPHEAEEFFTDEIVQGVFQPEALADVIGRCALFNPDLVEF